MLGGKKKKEKRKTSFFLSPLNLRIISPMPIYPQLSHLCYHGNPAPFFASVKDVGKGGMKWEIHCILGLSDNSKKQVCKEFNVNKLVEGIHNMTSAFLGYKTLIPFASYKSLHISD